MAKFILIDHSITDYSGHHYEYAVHVLKAAKEDGYNPILATNRKFNIEGQDPWEIHPVYRYGFWSEPPVHILGRWVDRALSAGAKRIHRLKIQMGYSYFGFLWNARDRGSYDDTLRRPLEQILHPAFLLILFFGYWWVLGRSFARLLCVAVPLQGYFHQVFDALKELAGEALYPASLFVKSWPRLRGKRHEGHRLRQFGSDTRRLFQHIQLEQGDLVFIPTLSLDDALGLLKYFHAEPNSILPTWHLLFRRNVYSGREPDYVGQDESLRPIGHAFQRFQNSLTGQKVYFYTDTDELTDQYIRLTGIPFGTLPIPHTHSPSTAPSLGDRPLRIIYVGDARHEKGYHYLPRVVQDLWVDYVETGKVAFLLQSNYNLPGGEPEAIVARAELQCYPTDKVKLLTEPLTSDEYRETLLSGDISLLLYDSQNYYARSSGILIESLAAGIPVIVPAGTWLAAQFIDEVYQHHLSIKEQMSTVKTYGGTQLYWRERPTACCSVGVPSGAQYLWITLRIPKHGVFVEMRLDQRDSYGHSARRNAIAVGKGNGKGLASAIVPLARNAVSVFLTFGNALADEPILSKSGIRLEFLQPHDPLQPLPLGAVGLTYGDPDEVSSLLKEMIDNYAHYRLTAQRFAPSIFERHNARRLVEGLKRTSGPLKAHKSAASTELDACLTEYVSLAR